MSRPHHADLGLTIAPHLFPALLSALRYAHGVPAAPFKHSSACGFALRPCAGLQWQASPVRSWASQPPRPGWEAAGRSWPGLTLRLCY